MKAIEVEVREAPLEQKPVLERLAQLYQYDFSEILAEARPEGGHVSDQGLFEYQDVDGYYNHPDSVPYVIYADGKIAGFVIVGRAHLLGLAAGARAIEEFFVMRRYRRRGVGTAAARQVFDRFPGHWEVAEVAPNAAAQSFWRKVIGEYAGGDFRETPMDDDRWRGPVQSFDSRQRPQVAC